MSRTIINVDKAIRDELSGYLGGVSFDDFFRVVNKMFSEGHLAVSGDKITFSGGIQYFDHPLIAEFKDACDSRAMDWEYGLKKAINAVREKRL